MTDTEFMQLLHENDISISLKGEKLLVDAPNGTLTEELKNELKARKSSLIGVLRDEENVISEESPGNPKFTSENIPVSYAQQSFLFLEKLSPGNRSNYIADACRIKGELDMEALTHSINEIMQRHEVLRTTYYYEDGIPCQKVNPFTPVEITAIDLIRESREDKQPAFRRSAEKVLKKAMDLEKGPLFKTYLFTLDEDEYIFLIKVHHIVFDGFSFGIFYKELSSHYAAYHSDTPPDLQELPLQYPEYARYQRSLIESGGLKNEIEYWKDKLKNAPLELEICTDKPRPKVQTYLGDKITFDIDEATLKGLREVSKNHKCSLFMVLTAVYQVLLFRYSHQNDFAVGFPISVRNRPELHNMLGMFVNMLALRTKILPEMPFEQILASNKKATAEAYAHQEVPFEKVVEALNISRDPARNPVFQHTIGLQPADSFELELADLQVSNEPVHIPGSQFDFHIQFREANDNLSGFFEFNTDLFKPSTMNQLLGHYKQIARSVIDQPGAKVSEIDLLTPSEHDMLKNWNSTDRDFHDGTGLLDYLQSVAEENWNRVALIQKKRQLTYHQLFKQAEKVAAYLQSRGIGRNQFVGICMERSAEMIIAVLGILKAGAAYVPLDAAYPSDRLEFMIQDAGLQYVLTQQSLIEKIPPAGAEYITFDSIDDNQFIGDSTYHKPNHQPGDTAYVIYTSGSTGTPKGVMVSYENLLAYTLAAGHEYGITNADRFLQFSTPSFDIFAEEVFITFATGATLVLRDEHIMEGTHRFWRFLKEKEISCISLPTAFWHALCSQLDRKRKPMPEKLRLVIVGGEAMSITMLEKWQRLMGTDIRIINSYGPTEATVAATAFDVTEFDTSTNSTIPIGKPMSNVKLFVLDEQGNKCPPGVPGELHIGGKQVATGYLNRPQLTEERFIPDPFEKNLKKRLYKTGDICRYLPDGNIVYIGRNDFQVKLRGLRIELGEIEQAILRHPSVKQAVVKLHTNHSGDQQLAGYLVPADVKIDLEELQEFLKEKLAAFMLPESYVILQKLPLTVNGKIDAKALPPPDRNSLVHQTDIVEAGNLLEEKIKQIWERVLDVRPIGVTDNFFNIGGNSLKAVILFDELSALSDKKLPLSTLFEAPTIRELAAIVSKNNKERTVPATRLLVNITGPQQKKYPSFFCVHGHFGNVLNFERLADRLREECTFYGLQAIGLDGQRKPLTSIEEIAARYIREIRKVDPKGPYRIGGFCFGTLIALEIAHQLSGMGHKVDRLVMFDPHPTIYPTLVSEETLGNFCSFVKRQRLEFHNAQLSRRKLFQKPAYMAKLISKKLLSSVQGSINTSVDWICGKLNKTIPMPLRHIEITNDIASKKYVRKPWKGEIDLFISRKATAAFTDNPARDWSGLAHGRVYLHFVEDDGIIAGGEMFNEPYVDHLAEELKNCLKQDRAYSHRTESENPEREPSTPQK